MDMTPGRVARIAERTAKIKEVAKWHWRHFSVRQIAEKTGLSASTVQTYIDLIKHSMQNHPDLDDFLRDLVARTGEELDRLQEQELKLFEVLDWASTLVPDTYGEKGDLQHVDPDGNLMMKPRSPGYVTQVTAQLAAIGRQRAELLKLIGNKVDITVNLEFSQKLQALLIEKIKEFDPVKYGEIRREIEVLADQYEKKGDKVALPPGKDYIDAEFVMQEAHSGG